MKIQLLVAALILIPSLSFADVLIACSNPEGTLLYNSSFHEGGAPPPPGHAPIPPFVTIRLNGTLLTNAPSTLTNEVAISHASSGQGSIQTSIFSATLTFQTATGSAQDAVICRDTNTLAP